MKRRIRREKSCTGKKKFPGRKSAEEAAGMLEKIEKRPIDAYKCRFCPHWHIGHRPRRKR